LLNDNTTYYWRVNASNGGSVSPWSSVWNFKTKQSGTGWIQINTGTNSTLLSSYFINSNTGFITGELPYVILKTINGGNTWVTTSFTDFVPTSIFFVNAYTGFTGGFSGSSMIYKTTDCGQTWNGPYYPGTASINCLYFVDANTGFYSGFPYNNQSGFIGKTTNGGSDWFISANLPANCGILSLFFVNSNLGFAVGNVGVTSTGAILKTVDGGCSWSVTTFPNTGQFSSVFFTSNNVGFAICGGIYKTLDGGNSWNVVQLNCGQPYKVFFSDVNTGYASGIDGNRSIVLKTTNGGFDWDMQPLSNVNCWFSSVYFISPNTGFVTGKNGLVYKTTTGGQ
jgi:photosystem II stability/assembly factor-like uncharacterized protein